MFHLKLIPKTSEIPLTSFKSHYRFKSFEHLKQPYATYGKSLTTNYQNFLKSESITAEIKQFRETFPFIIQNLVNDNTYSDIPEAVSCFEDILVHTVPNGKGTRALSLIRSYKGMEDTKNLTSENIRLMNILGWYMELFHAAFIVIDDIIDNSQTRHGKKCWYKNVGMRAILDRIVLENYAYQLLKKHFSHLPMYFPAMEISRETATRMVMGELLDSNPLDPSRFSKRRFETLARYKTTVSALELPYNLARCLSNKYCGNIPQRIHEMLLKLGLFYQIQNDFLDCYDDESLSHKTGNDIEEGKCTWLIVTALEKATNDQRRHLMFHYGNKDTESVATVKELFNVLAIPMEYSKIEKETFDFIEKNIDQVSKIACHELMFKRLGNLYEQYL